MQDKYRLHKVILIGITGLFAVRRLKQSIICRIPVEVPFNFFLGEPRVYCTKLLRKNIIY